MAFHHCDPKSKADEKTLHPHVVAADEGQGVGCTPCEGGDDSARCELAQPSVRSGRTGARQLVVGTGTQSGQPPWTGSCAGRPWAEVEESPPRYSEGIPRRGKKDSTPGPGTTADIRNIPASSRTAALSSVGVRRMGTSGPGPETEPDGTAASPRTQTPETSSPTTARGVWSNPSCYRRDKKGLTTSSVPRPTLPALK